MSNEALSIIGTKGLVGAIEAADAMIKAANMVLIDYEKIGSGLVTVTVCGGVGAVKASVDVGVATTDIAGEVVSRRVIPRSRSNTEKMLP